MFFHFLPIFGYASYPSWVSFEYLLRFFGGYGLHP
jgi:hypothetical protein